MVHNLPRLMLAAPASGSGKTTCTIGLLQALLKRGLKPAAFKCGPDFIDPLFHRRVLGTKGYNLDLFFTSPELTRGLLAKGAAAADIAVIEGVMGYYDGAGLTTQASSWQLAVETQSPTLLLLRPGASALSSLALLQGFCRFREDSRIQGVILNECSSEFAARLAPLIEESCGVKVYGYLPKITDIRLESRHLGLVSPDSIVGIQEKIQRLAAMMEKTIDIDGILKVAAGAPPLHADLPSVKRVVPQTLSLAIAQDEAFSFYYRENLDLLESFGFSLQPFSPLRDRALPKGISALYLGGGYPELHAKTLAENESMRMSVQAAVRSGLPTLAECGGFLYLQACLQDKKAVYYPMAGALSGSAFNGQKLSRFGYVSLTARKDNLLCAKGALIRGHEFHYWDSTEVGDSFIAQKPHSEKNWNCIQTQDQCVAGFPHLYFWSNPSLAENFVRAASSYERGKEVDAEVSTEVSTEIERETEVGRKIERGRELG